MSENCKFLQTVSIRHSKINFHFLSLVFHHICTEKPLSMLRERLYITLLSLFGRIMLSKVGQIDCLYEETGGLAMQI